ncbi:Dcp2, box A domain-containing protein, partial [Entophlyctis helioformis]
SRFIINVPEEELQSIERVCFQIEQAHWFYEDFVREESPRLPSFSLKNFSSKLFRHCPLLQHWANHHELAFAQFMEYKTRVPVCGAILLNQNLTKTLLVRGWKSSAAWGFAKGKINKDEPEIECAVREVYEETGFDASPYIRQNEYIERTIQQQRIRLYIIAGIPETTTFATRTRKEVGDIRWFELSSLPGFDNAESDTGGGGGGGFKFFFVTAFAAALRRWIRR